MTSTHDLEMNDLRPVQGDNEPDPARDHEATEPLLASSSSSSYNSSPLQDASSSHLRESETFLKRVCPAGIASLTVQVPDSNKGTNRTFVKNQTRVSTAKPSRWITREFYVYYAIIAFYLPLMVYTTAELSSREWRQTPARLFTMLIPRIII